MKIAIVGSRNFKSLDRVANVITSLPSDSIIISGGAVGVDKLAEQMADFLGLSKIIFRPDWEKYQPKEFGKKNPAGMIRNREIVKNADCVIAFWDGKSKGTENSILTAIKMKKPVIIIRED